MADVPLAARRGSTRKCAKTKPRIQRRGPEVMKTLRETAFWGVGIDVPKARLQACRGGV